MTLMERRRALMAEGKPSGEKWDYIWKYTDGLPDANGATLVTSGNYDIQMSSDGLEITTTGGANNYVAYRFPNLQTPNGTIEAEFIAASAIGSGQYIRVGYSDGQKGFQTQAANGIISPYGITTPSANLILGAINTVRSAWNGSKGAFWVNSNFVGEDLNPTSYSSNTQVMIQATSNAKITLRAIRIRKE